MSKFLTELNARLLDDDKIWSLDDTLKYESDILGCIIEIPIGFQMDFASVPRLPFIYSLFGDKAHREGVLHDYLFRKDSMPIVSFNIANKIFLEAMASRNKSKLVRYCMYWGVCLGGRSSYHKKNVNDILYKRGNL
ncbi:MAG: DUF1353 domain-containing protein [Novosphingobium sp.]|jgi:hypothetical protein|nr:DUF1353 domain-containing protein [Novosphingobium sp.]